MGSNIGNRMAAIGRAIAAVERLTGTTARVSRPVHSEPWGYDSPNAYVNVGVAVDTDLEPLALLDALRTIERDISPAPHRHADGSYADRVIDIDIIMMDRRLANGAYQSVVMDTERLTLPHPRMALRPFVTCPLLELRDTLDIINQNTESE